MKHVIRTDHYYGGDLEVGLEYDDNNYDTVIEWRAYAAGSARIRMTGAERRLMIVALQAIENADQ